ENDLIDDYVRGQLELEQRELFERNFLSSPEQRKRVEIARTLLPGLDRIETAGENRSAAIENPAKRVGFFSFSFNPQLAFRLAGALAILLFATVCAWLLRENMRLRQDLRIAQEDAARRERDLGQQLADGRQQNARLVDEIAQLRSNSSPQIS